MLKIAAAGATALCAGILCTTPYSLNVTPQGSVSLSLDRAAARIGHPLTPMSAAGVHRRAMRRTFGVGTAATGAGYGGGGWGGWGWNRPLFASAVGVGGSGVGMMGAAFCCRTFDYSTGWNQFCPGIGFVWGTGQSHQ